MAEDNKRNIMFFESSTMRGLYEQMDAWQVENRKRFHSASINKDGDAYCCIALSNPTEVVLVDTTGESVYVYGHSLAVSVRS